MAQKSKRDNLKLFNRNSFPLSTFLMLFTLCLVIMGVDYRYQILKKIRSEIIVMISPINNLINLPVKIFHESKNKLITKESLEREIKNLEKVIFSMSIQVQENKLIKAENKHLRRTLEVQEKFNIKGINAEIVLPKVRNGFSVITIDKGHEDKIEEGAPVINNSGLVGQIVNTYQNYSEIKPITSKSYAVPAIMNDATENIILYGNGNGELEIPLFPASSLIKINDIFITSGIDEIYPKGIKIGKVSKIKKTKSPKFNSILVKPFSQPTSFTQILILKIKK